MIIPSARRTSPADSVEAWETHAVISPPLVPDRNSYLTLTPINGRLYLGHGEWTSNLGPTNVISIGPDGDVTVDLPEVMSDALDTFREIDGAIYAPYTDPRGADKGGFATNAGGEWHAVEFTSTLMVHCFDMGATSHGLWMVGSAHRVEGTTIPVVLLSTDGGATWTEVNAGPRGSMARYYGLWVEGDAVFVRQGSGPVLTSSDGGQTWSEIDRPDLYLALSSSGHRRPHYVRTPDPTPYEQVLRDWSPAMPAASSDFVVLDGVAYCAAQTGSLVTIYSRPAPEGV